MIPIDVHSEAFDGNCNEIGNIRLVSSNPGRYLNLIVKLPNCTISGATAVRLRDALLEIYPLEAPTNTYDPKNPKVGDLVQPSLYGMEIPRIADARVPLQVVAVRHHTSFGIYVDVEDAGGKEIEGWYAPRYEAYQPRAGATGSVSAKSPWQTVTDGIDRMKVVGGWLYQSDTGSLAFVPERVKA